MQEAASTSSRHCETPLRRSCRCRYRGGNGNVFIVSFCCCWRTFTAPCNAVLRESKRRRYASQGHRAESLYTGRERTPFLSPPWFASSLTSRVFRPCAALSSLACCCLPWLSLPAPARRYASHRKSLYRRHVCVRGYQPGLTPAKHCEGKRFLNFRRKRSADRLPKPSSFCFSFCLLRMCPYFSRRVCLCKQQCIVTRCVHATTAVCVDLLAVAELVHSAVQVFQKTHFTLLMCR